MTSLVSLASSVTVGGESNTVDNTSTLADDYMLTAVIKTGASIHRGMLHFFIVPQDGTNVGSPATGSDAALTILNAPIGVDSMRPGDPLPGSSFKYLGSADLRGLATGTAYNFLFRGIGSLLGGSLTAKYSVFVLNMSGATLASSGSSISQTAITYTTA